MGLIYLLMALFKGTFCIVLFFSDITSTSRSTNVTSSNYPLRHNKYFWQQNWWARAVHMKHVTAIHKEWYHFVSSPTASTIQRCSVYTLHDLYCLQTPLLYPYEEVVYGEINSNNRCTVGCKSWEPLHWTVLLLDCTQFTSLMTRAQNETATPSKP